MSKVFYLIASWTSALIYGKESLSSKVGRRSLPTTLSISCWALVNTSGCEIIARMNDFKTMTIYHAHEYM